MRFATHGLMVGSNLYTPVPAFVRVGRADVAPWFSVGVYDASSS